MKIATIAASIALGGVLLTDERQFAAALQQWQRNRSLGSLLHLAASGFFLAEDVAVLG